MDHFMDVLKAAAADQQAYVDTLPHWVKLWMNWMMLCLFFGSLVFSFFKVEARWLLLGFFLSIVATFVVGINLGWNQLWGVTHLIFWTPVAVYFYRRLPVIEKRSIYGVWFMLALATMCVSLVFDAKDVVQYFLHA